MKPRVPFEVISDSVAESETCVPELVTAEVTGRLGSSELLEEGLLERWIETEERQLTSNS
jgi:hypothetical protein